MRPTIGQRLQRRARVLSLLVLGLACARPPEPEPDLPGSVFYQLPAFDRVLNATALEVLMDRGSDHHALLTCEQRLLDRIALQVRAGQLHVERSRERPPSAADLEAERACVLRVTMPDPLLQVAHPGRGENAEAS